MVKRGVSGNGGRGHLGIMFFYPTARHLYLQTGFLPPSRDLLAWIPPQRHYTFLIVPEPLWLSLSPKLPKAFTLNLPSFLITRYTSWETLYLSDHLVTLKSLSPTSFFPQVHSNGSSSLSDATTWRMHRNLRCNNGPFELISLHPLSPKTCFSS